jgi:hypothetical protein
VKPEELLGKTVVVGLTYVAPDGTIRERFQFHGEVVGIDESGVSVREPSGEIFTLPPSLDAFERAISGAEYRLRSSGVVVSEPDFVASWTIQLRDDDDFSSQFER